MLRQRKKVLDTMIYELENEDVVSSDHGEATEQAITPAKKRKKGRKRKKNTRAAVATETTKNFKFQKRVNNSEVINLTTDDCILLSDDGDVTAHGINNTVEDEKIVTAMVVNDAPVQKVPLFSIRFRDASIAKCYKSRIREYVRKLLVLSKNEKSSDGSSDLELNIWSDEEIVEEKIIEKKVVEEKLIQKTIFEEKSAIPSPVVEPESNMFIIDTDPTDTYSIDVPAYSNKFGILKDGQVQDTRTPKRKGPICFNCDGSHALKDCTLKKDYSRINQKRKETSRDKMGRYHTEDEQRFGHLIPGRISRKLRNALTLKKNQLPLHIYRMRLLGYPPGWIEAARIEHSGMTLFDSLGKEIADPEDEDGEICDVGSKDKFDIKKIFDFPGFNVPASSRYKDECNMYGCPPIDENQSKLAMLQEMAPNAMQAYKRKKLKLIDTANQDDEEIRNEVEADMEIASDDDEGNSPDFPFVPPLPDEPPPPSDVIPPPPSSSEEDSPPPVEEGEITSNSENVLENDTDGRPPSPPLSDLEKRKKQLLDALSEGDNTQTSGVASSEDVPSNSANGEDPSTPKVGKIKSSVFGTPLIDASSPYGKLPGGDKFSKNICDIINFENLPDSTGKYSQISGLIKKVRNVVSKIQSET